MLTHKTSRLIWSQLAAADKEWFTAPESIKILEKCRDIIAERCGEKEAEYFMDLVFLAGIS